MVSGALRAGVSSFCSTNGSALNSNRIGLFAGDVAASSQKQATKRITAHIAGRDARSIARGTKAIENRQEGWPKPPFKFYLTLASEVELYRERQHTLAGLECRLASRDGVCVRGRNRMHGIAARTVADRQAQGAANVSVGTSRTGWNRQACVLLQINGFVGGSRQPELVQRMIQEVRTLYPELQLL